MRIFNTIHDGNVNWLELEKGLIRIPYTDYKISNDLYMINYQLCMFISGQVALI